MLSAPWVALQLELPGGEWGKAASAPVKQLGASPWPNYVETQRPTPVTMAMTPHSCPRRQPRCSWAMTPRVQDLALPPSRQQNQTVPSVQGHVRSINPCPLNLSSASAAPGKALLGDAGGGDHSSPPVTDSTAGRLQPHRSQPESPPALGPVPPASPCLSTHESWLRGQVALGLPA